jgi:hypothetical protein
MQDSVSRSWRWSAWVFAAIGAVAAYIYFRLDWAPHFDFDILGVAWLFFNFAKIGAFIVMVLSFVFSVYLWIRSRLAR